MDLEAGRKRSGVEDIFISYHAKDDVQSTYAGALFHNGRNYHVSSYKNNVSRLFFFFDVVSTIFTHFLSTSPAPCTLSTTYHKFYGLIWVSLLLRIHLFIGHPHVVCLKEISSPRGFSACYLTIRLASA